MKSWKLALAGVVALGSATAGAAKVIALDASASAIVGGEADSSGHMPGQPNSFTDYVKSGYIVPGLAVASGMESFRELSNAGASWMAHDVGTGDTDSWAGSARSSGIRETHTGMILLTIGTLVAYQLRRKQQLLKQPPFAV
jgi:hypothetical protein